MISRNKELEERCSHLEAKYDKLIEMYNGLLDGAGNGNVAPVNPPVDPDAGSKTTPKRHPEGGRRSSYNVREFVGYPQAQTSCKKRGRPAREGTRGARNHDCRRACVPQVRLHAVCAHGQIRKKPRRIWWTTGGRRRLGRSSGGTAKSAANSRRLGPKACCQTNTTE